MAVFRTVPNQKIVTIGTKTIANKEHFYTCINNEAMFAACRDLSLQGSFKLYMYFASNAENYKFGLSSSDVEKRMGVKIKSYNEAVKELISKGYLIHNGGNQYTFYDTPHVMTSEDNECPKNEHVVPVEDNQCSKTGHVMTEQDNESSKNGRVMPPEDNEQKVAPMQLYDECPKNERVMTRQDNALSSQSIRNNINNINNKISSGIKKDNNQEKDAVENQFREPRIITSEELEQLKFGIDYTQDKSMITILKTGEVVKIPRS